MRDVSCVCVCVCVWVGVGGGVTAGGHKLWDKLAAELSGSNASSSLNTAVISSQSTTVPQFRAASVALVTSCY